MPEPLITLLPRVLVYAVGLVAQSDRGKLPDRTPRNLVVVRGTGEGTVEVSGTDGFAVISVEVDNGVGAPAEDVLFSVVDPPRRKPTGSDIYQLQAAELAPIQGAVERPAVIAGLELFKRSQDPGSLNLIHLERLIRAFRATGVTVGGLQTNRDATRITAANRWGKTRMIGYLAGVITRDQSQEDHET